MDANDRPSGDPFLRGSADDVAAPGHEVDGAEAVDFILAPYFEAAERGEAIDREAIVRNHPEHAEAIRRFFMDCDAFDGCTGASSPGACPRRFGEYVLLEELGRGGMGVVYRARQEAPSRVVALKKALPLARESDRFRIETEAAARLRHPNILAIHEVGVEEGEPYFTMPLIEGGSLASHVGRLGATGRLAAGFLLKLARAMQHAHERGVLHRDLKPANILLDEGDEPRIADFGLAKLVESDASLTLHGAFIGTASYVAPEQATGRQAAPTVAGDVHGLGLILYELLAGQPAFQGETPLETLRKVETMPPRPPSRLRPNVSRDLETICLKCLEKEAGRRYASAAELADDLERYLERRPIQARPASQARRLWMWAKRRPGAAGTVGISALGLLAVTVVSLLSNVWLEASRRELALRLYAARAREAHDAAARRDFGTAETLLREVHRRGLQEGILGFEWSHLLRRIQTPAASLWLVHGTGGWVGFSPRGDVFVRVGSGPDSGGMTFSVPEFTRRHLRMIVGGQGAGFTPDGGALIVLSYVGVLNAFDGETLIDLIPRDGLDSRGTCVALSPCGEVAAVGHADGGIRLWAWRERALLWASGPADAPQAGDRDDDRRSGASGGEPPGDENPMAPLCLAFSPAGDVLAAGTAGGPVRLWQGPSWNELPSLPGQPHGTHAIAFTHDGAAIFTGGAAEQHGGLGAVACWSLSTRLPLPGGLVDDGGPVRALALAPDGRTLATGGVGRVVRVWDVTTGQELVSLTGPSATIASVAYSPDGAWLASGSDEGTGFVWKAPRLEDVEARGEPAIVEGQAAEARCAVVTDRGDALITAGVDDSVRRWSLGSMGCIARLPREARGLRLRAISPDGAWAMADREERLHLHPLGAPDGADPGLETPTDVGTFNVTVLAAFSADSRQVGVLANDGKSIRIWRRPEGRGVRWQEEEPCPVLVGGGGESARVPSLLAFSPDGRFLAYAPTRSWYTCIWRLDRRSEPLGVQFPSAATALAFSPDSRWLASGRELTISLLDLSTLKWGGGQPVECEQFDACFTPDRVTALCWSSDSSRLVSGSLAGAVSLWMLTRDDGKPVALSSGVMSLHSAAVSWLAFTPDGRNLISIANRKHEPTEIRVSRSLGEGRG